MLTPARIERAVPWIARAVWVAVAVAGGEAIEAATAERSAAVGAVATLGGATGWLLGVAALTVPSVIGLTATRATVPLGVPAAIVAWAAGGGTAGAAFVVAATAATVVVTSAELGRAFVQASAYGDEDRHLLRPPPGYALAALVTWCLWAVASVAAPLLLGARNWPAGGLLAAAAVGLGVWSWPRWHRLSRRWFVVVPVGIVVHDELVLAETLMLRRHTIGAIRLAPADTAAADLTGPAGGHAIEVATTEPATAVRSGTPRDPGGSAIHLTAFLIAPTRPGRALAAATRRPAGARGR